MFNRHALFAAVLAAAPDWAQPERPAPQWTVSATPSLDIGDDRNTQTQFDGVTGILRMPGGEIVVANGMSQELRIFSPTGAHLRTIARSGAGAGELRSLNRIWRGGDTIFAAEALPGESNVHLFSTIGFLRKRPVGASNAGGISPLDRFTDGRLVITAARRAGRTIQGGRPVMDSIPLGVISLPELRPSWIGSLVSEMMVTQDIGPGRGRRVSLSQVPFGRWAPYAVSGDRLWVGDSDTGVITQFSSTGRKLVEFTAPIAPRPIDSTLMRRQRESQLSDAMNWNDRARIDGFYSIPLPRTAPRFIRFLPGTDGEMWLELYQEAAGAPRLYLVVDRAGRAIGSVTMPRGTTPFEVGASSFLGVRRDADGLEHVVAYSLKR